MPATNLELPLQFSPAAIAEINRLCRQRGDTVQIRLGIAPGGCQGQRYTLGFRVDEILPTDQVYAGENLRVAIAPEAIPALQGCTLDYAEDLMGGNFRFHQPPVSPLCSCGLSFPSLEPSS